MSRPKGRKPRRKSAGRRKPAKTRSAAPAPARTPAPTPERPAGPLRLRAAAVTHQGNLRPHNEDCIGVCEWARRIPMISPVSFECAIDEPRLCVVADGLGGHAGGEMASVMGVLHLIQSIRELQSGEAVATAMRQANKAVYETMDTNPELRAMGSTLVGLAACGHSAWLFNVGDSRGYIVPSGGPLRLASTDDTTEFRADWRERTGQRQHTITQCLGGQPFFDDIDPHIVSCELTPGDRILLCSDGLTDMLDQAGIERCLMADGHASVTKLLEAALAEGGLDNISIILVDILSAEDGKPS
jgi:serine/threonine protein phosphatase PrpC